MNDSAADTDGLAIVGWREFLALPDFGVKRIKAKVDTGARSSSLHASEIEEIVVEGRTFVQFQIHPLQRSLKKSALVRAPLIEYRTVRSSIGEAQERPVVLTSVQLMSQRWEIELTLANRTEMGFRMLLGREAVRGRFLVDPGNSYIAGPPSKKQS